MTDILGRPALMRTLANSAFCLIKTRFDSICLSLDLIPQPQRRIKMRVNRAACAFLINLFLPFGNRNVHQRMSAVNYEIDNNLKCSLHFFSKLTPGLLPDLQLLLSWAWIASLVIDCNVFLLSDSDYDPCSFLTKN